MKLFTDNIDYTHKFYPECEMIIPDILLPHQKKLALELLPDNIFAADIIDSSIFDEVYITPFSKYSQYDLLTDISEKIDINRNIICVAGEGNNFHGYKNRSWSALKGNLHVSIYLSPKKEIQNFNTGFTIITALSVLESLYEVPELKENLGIKWVNDIMIGKKKISGVLARTRLQGFSVTDVIVGAGINIAQRPDLSGDVFVKEATSVNDESKQKYSDSEIYHLFIQQFQNNYNLLLNNNYNKLLDKYRKANILLNQKVKLMKDQSEPELIAEGKVTGIGDNLEVVIDNTPYTIGRVLW